MNWTIPILNWTIPILNWTIPILKWIIPILNWTIPILDWTTPILNWKRYRQFLTVPIVQTLLPVTFAYETIEEMKEAVTKVIDTLTYEDFHRAFQKLLELYNKCIAAGGDYFEGD